MKQSIDCKLRFSVFEVPQYGLFFNYGSTKIPNRPPIITLEATTFDARDG